MSTKLPFAAPEPHLGRGRGRRPADEVRADVLAATSRLLFADGLTAVTFERVAARAQASRTTLHKWWPTPGALAAEAYFDSVAESLDFPDTGDIQADVRTQLRAFVRLMTTQDAGRVARQLIGAAQTDPAVREAFITHYARPRRDEAIAVLDRARQRGQIRADLPLGILVDQLWGACYHRLLVLGDPLDEDVVDQLIRNAFHGAAS